MWKSQEEDLPDFDFPFIVYNNVVARGEGNQWWSFTVWRLSYTYNKYNYASNFKFPTFCHSLNGY